MMKVFECKNLIFLRFVGQQGEPVTKNEILMLPVTNPIHDPENLVQHSDN